MINFEKLKNKKVLLPFLLITAIIFSILFLMHENVIYDSYKFELASIDNVITANDITNIDGYQKEDNKFIVDKDDASFKIDTQQVIGALKLNVDLSSDDVTEIKIYYSGNETFTEIHTYSASLEKSDESVIFNIPLKENSEHFMVKVSDDFTLNNIEFSNNNALLEKVSTTSSNYLVFCIVDFIISIIGAYLLTFKVSLSKIKERLNKENLKKYAIRAILYIGSLGCAIAVQCVFTGQFVASIDGHYVINFARLAFTIMFITLFWGVIWLRDNFKDHIEKIFLLISLSVGITFAIVLPMLQESTWDAGIHYGNTIELVYFDQNELPQLDKGVGWLDYSYNVNDLNSLKEKYNDNYYIINGTEETQDFTLVKLYNFLGYIPHALGIFVARGLTLSFSASVLLGKVFNSVCYSIIVYFAMKRLHTGKLIMFIIALYPTMLLLAGTYSYDPWVNALILFGVAYLFANIQEKDKLISTKEMILIPLSLFIAIGPKAIYFPIMLLCYFLPKSKFASNKQRYIYYGITSALMLFTVVSFLVPFITGVSSGTEVGDTRGGADVNSSLQVRYVLAHPIEFIKTLFTFMVDYWSFGNIANYTTNIAYIGQGQFSIVLVVAMIGNLIIGEKSDSDKNISGKFKIFTIVLMIGLSCVVAAAFYVAYTPVGANFISGCQARYVLPLLFPLAYCLRNTYKIIEVPAIVKNVVTVSMCTIVLVYALFSKIIMNYFLY